MIDDRHTCGNDCACPIHRTPLIYSPAGDDHACQDAACEHGSGMGAGWRPPLFPVRPDGLGELLHSLLAEPEWQSGEPYVHTIREPDPVPVLDDDGQPLLDEAGEPVTYLPSGPSYTMTHTTDGRSYNVPIAATYWPPDTPERRVARILTDAGWTDATLRPAAESAPLNPDGVWYITNRTPGPAARADPPRPTTEAPIVRMVIHGTGN